jgi:hypothetical protein
VRMTTPSHDRVPGVPAVLKVDKSPYIWELSNKPEHPEQTEEPQIRKDLP